LLIDDASRYTSVCFLKGKDQVTNAVKDHLTYLKVREKNPLEIRTDRGREFINDALITWCQSNGIHLQMTAPYSPSQNGVAERMNRTLVELARAMLIDSQLPEFLWEHAVAHAAYVRNRSFTKAVTGRTPYEGWFGTRPNVAHLREFGAPVWVLAQGPHQSRKMLPKSNKRIYVGYEDGSNSVLYYNAQSRKVLTSRNHRALLPMNRTSPEPVLVTPLEGEMTGIEEQDPTEPIKRKANQLGTVDEPRKARKARVDYRKLHDPFPDGDEAAYYNDCNMSFETNAEMYACAIEAGDDYQSLKEAKASNEWPEWEAAIRVELSQLDAMGTWRLVDPPNDAKPIGNKWVFAKKRNKDGQLTKYKARLVAKGFAQRPGYDYVETHSPVVRLETIRILLALAQRREMIIQQMDVKGAYLNGTLKERVYMRQPEGFEDGTQRVCLLVKTLYGLKQSGREWNIELDTKMRQNGYTLLLSDPCVYLQRSSDGLSIATVWVDDLLLFASSKPLMAKMKASLQRTWQVTDLGEPTKIVGIEVARDRDSLTICQRLYIDSILSKQGLAKADKVSTPLDHNVPIQPNPEGNEGNRSNAYAQLLGSLQFLANATRPDIAYAVNRLASYTANPSMQHQTALKRVLRYLSGTKNYALTYRTIPNADGNMFHGFADAAFANNDDCTSTSGYVFLAQGGALTWRSVKQTLVTLSTTHTEYVALSESAREACWLKTMMEELGFPQPNPITIYGDNDGSIQLSKNPQFHKRTKHIAIRWHWIRDLVRDSEIIIESCRDSEQTADVLTKPLPRPKHRQHAQEMGLVTV
jgi:hypothetical protein